MKEAWNLLYLGTFIITEDLDEARVDRCFFPDLDSNFEREVWELWK